MGRNNSGGSGGGGGKEFRDFNTGKHITLLNHGQSKLKVSPVRKTFVYETITVASATV